MAYLALLKTQKGGFLVACGVLLGFALLSKYTAFILLAFFILSATGKIIFQKEKSAFKTDWKTVARYIFEIMLIFIISLTVFAFFLPAVFVNPNYLFKGISQFLRVFS